MHVTQLLEKNNDEFVSAAYLALLNRQADPAGGQNYRRMMSEGASKLQILYSIYVSTECRPREVNIIGLMDAFAELRRGAEGNNSQPLIKESGRNALCVDDLLLQDGDDFIASAYLLLLRRPVDQVGLDNYRDRLSGGASKTQVLYELSLSPEYIAVGIDPIGLVEAFSKEGLGLVGRDFFSSFQRGSIVATSLEEILKQQGANFVESAYRTLLRRPPDEAGFQYYLTKLMNGCSKLQILG
ncbi:MAG: DUF4214 domain-containing protein [Betaproteobacteria bacterium]|nr:DUF4214 domain-containing protein [Betaproteobacteria bacterium]